MSQLNVLAKTELAPPETLFGLRADEIARDRASYPVRLFRAMADRVPAYKDFLKRHSIRPETVQTISDLAKVPAIDKENYLRHYPLQSLVWDGDLQGKSLIYTSSSGSTGEPFYFPRDSSLDLRSSLLFELALKSMSRGQVKKTLYIVSFGMGVWIGGMISFQSVRRLADRGYPITVITPGTNKQEVFEALKRLAPQYEQVVLGGYPPFVKDILDEAPDHGFDKSKTPLKIFCAAEGFNETFREHVMRGAGGVNPTFDTTNLYGTADIGTMAIETPLSIALRRAAVGNTKLYGELFSNASQLPTFAQFHPAVVDFTESEGELFVSGYSALPLVRYALGDRGGIIGYSDAMRAAETHAPGFADAAHHEISNVPPLPFVYVYERADFSTKLYGALVHAEHVRDGLQHENLQPSITGKFCMSTKRDSSENEYLEVIVEMKSGVDATENLAQNIGMLVRDTLMKKNTEYRNSADSAGGPQRLVPRVILRTFGDPEHFKPGTKQRWVKK